MNEARIEISMQQRKNMEIPSELLKIAKLDERPKPIVVKADNPTINLQQPNPSPFLGTNPSKPKMPDTGYHSASRGTFHGIVGTSTLTDKLRLKKENLDIQDYFNSGDIHKQTPPQRNPRKIVHSSAELQKILSPKCRGSGTKVKQSLFQGSNSCASSSQNPMKC